jgi:hypothetical protein
MLTFYMTCTCVRAQSFCSLLCLSPVCLSAPWKSRDDHFQSAPYFSPYTQSNHYLFFWWYWGLNSGFQTCWEGALPPKSQLQPLFSLVTLKMESRFLPRLAWTKILSFQAFCCSWDDRCTPPCSAFLSIGMGSQKWASLELRSFFFKNFFIRVYLLYGGIHSDNFD